MAAATPASPPPPAWVQELREEWAAGARNAEVTVDPPSISVESESPRAQAMLVEGDCVPAEGTAEAAAASMRARADNHAMFRRSTLRLASILKPTACVLVLAALLSGVVLAALERDGRLVFRNALPYKRETGDSLGRRARGALLNGSVILAAFVVVSYAVAAGLRFGGQQCLRRSMQPKTFLLLGCPLGFLAHEYVMAERLRVDWLSLLLVTANFATVGGLTVACDLFPRTSWVTHAFLVCLVVFYAWPFLEWPLDTVFATLALLFVFDLLAVLCPCGPLRYIMERRAEFRVEELPGLILCTPYFLLGTGDLVFYAVVVGHAAEVEWRAALASALGVLSGLALTVILTTVSTLSALPALPLSVALGLPFLFLCRPVLFPFAAATARATLGLP